MSACSEPLAFELDELVHGDLPQEDTAALRQHLAACPGCAGELSSLRAEHQALSSRESPPPAKVVPLHGRGFAEVRDRVRTLRARDRTAARRSLLFAALGAAAALVIAAQSRAPEAARESVSPGIPWCGTPADAVASAESEFAACLLATPRALPGSPAVCL